MPMPTDIGVIDLMIGFPTADRRHNYDFLRANLRDRESLDEFEFPAQYMFKNVPKVDAPSDPVHALLELMDKYGIERAMIGVSSRNDDSLRALRDHPDRFFGCMDVDPNRGMEAVRDLWKLRARPSPDALARRARAWRPHRAVAARLLWHHYLSERGRS